MVGTITERKKLLTRARGILLDNDIFTADQVMKMGLPGLLKLTNMGPKAANVVIEAVAGAVENWDQEVAYLFPHPQGTDAATDYAVVPDASDAPEWPDQGEYIHINHVRMLGIGLDKFGSDWAIGYAQALVDIVMGKLTEDEIKRRLHDGDTAPPVVRLTPEQEDAIIRGVFGAEPLPDDGEYGQYLRMNAALNGPDHPPLDRETFTEVRDHIVASLDATDSVSDVRAEAIFGPPIPAGFPDAEPAPPNGVYDQSGC